MVTLLNFVVSAPHGFPGGSFVIQYRSSTPPSDTAGRRTEAAEIVEMHRAFAETKRLDTIRAEICNTEAAAQMRELPEAWFEFERVANDAWHLREEGA